MMIAINDKKEEYDLEGLIRPFGELFELLRAEFGWSRELVLLNDDVLARSAGAYEVSGGARVDPGPSGNRCGDL
jgi:hypothetical protein